MTAFHPYRRVSLVSDVYGYSLGWRPSRREPNPRYPISIFSPGVTAAGDLIDAIAGGS
jgi:hypothetical protein